MSELDLNGFPVPSQPDGIADDSRDLPDPRRAARRVSAYISGTGDGLYAVADPGDGRPRPLYGRDLEALCRSVRALAELRVVRDQFRDSALMYAAMVAERNDEIEKLRAENAEHRRTIRSWQDAREQDMAEIAGPEMFHLTFAPQLPADIGPHADGLIDAGMEPDEVADFLDGAAR